MARNTKEAYDLSDAEKRDLVQLIQAGKPLPEKYRFILFEDKREVELLWNGKNRDVCTTVLPFQTLEHIDEPRAETKVQEELFDSRGRQSKGWTNKLIWGDNKLILSSLKAGALRRQIEDAGGLKLIYIDPPFDVGADFSMDIEIGGETFHKEPNLLEQIAYRDTWGRGADSFISMIYERLILMRDLLAEDGSIYVHCDWRMVGALRSVMEEVFSHIENVISWKRSALAAGVKTQWRNSQDFILFFSKSGRHTFNPQFGEYSQSSKEHYSHKDERGVFQPVPILASGRSSGDTGAVWRGIDPNKLGKNGMHWLKNPKVLEELDSQGLIYWPAKKGGSPRLKYYEKEAKGVYVSDFWNDIDVINSMADEFQGYNTQKPEALLERVIKASSNTGDLVADFFVGSGTTAAVAEKLGRKWIATDLGKFAIHTTRKRLIGVQRELKQADKEFRAFEVLNLGRYERQAYLNVGGRLSGAQKEQALAEKEREFRELILRAYKAEPFDSDAFFDGKQGGRLVVVGPINLPVGRLFVEEVIMETRKRGATRVDVLAFEFEMGLFPAVLEEAKAKGIDLTPKYIPADVFDKRAVDRGQVVFHDISFVEATPRYTKGKTARDKLTVKIELTDFSVYYSQGAAESAIAALKDGQSDVICDQGQLLKIGKNKDGVITREVLTKTWTDWVDYWAVDFDYQSRREMIKVPLGVDTDAAVATPASHSDESPLEFEERWTGGYIFENEWQSFRTRKKRELDMITADHTYERAGRYIVAVKVVDIFGNDTMTLVPVNVG
ncbi:site-specific DNA-methyltransferase [Oleiagrimonas sp.]|jgi:adenine-specific DNA-methyltransferase|uniref:site-specific DNA-methyltransferase n=1 Tax=Oleiagrimonas sp. TaxID=2010330 RepID=UPI00262139DF|nr:site-specific DNA-methyltransferase [Oleiagrimonas sp.]MDA3914728.1 site-specific DNA-methyltransferase [Oleiagrimonas sp.]